MYNIPGREIRSDIHGALAQLGERKVRNLEVRGSIPLCSTMKNLTFVYQDKCEVFQRNKSLAGFVKYAYGV